MKLFFIRHAKALPREEWSDDDLLRPLSKKGEKECEEFFKKIHSIYEIDLIISSEAKRALETAKIVKKYYPKATFKTSKALNPGANYEDIKNLLNKNRDFNKIALVGHEPDFSIIVSKFLGCSYLKIDVKKSSIIELSGEDLDELELKSYITPKILKAF